MSMERTDEPEPKVTEIDPTAGAGEDTDDEPLVPVEKNAKGEDVAPVSAVISYRKESKAAKAEVARLKAEVEQLRVVKEQVEAMAPVLERIRQDPSILQRASEPKKQPDRDPFAERVADRLGLIDATGLPDASRGQEILQMIREEAARIADERVAPVRQATAEQIARSNWHSAREYRHTDGAAFASDESLQQVFNALPHELTANPAVAALLPLMAAGLDKKLGRTPKAPPVREYDEPWFSESPSGTRTRTLLTDEDKAFTKSIGVDDKKLEAGLRALQTNGRRGGFSLE